MVRRRWSMVHRPRFLQGVTSCGKSTEEQRREMNRIRIFGTVCAVLALMATGGYGHPLDGVRIGRTSEVEVEQDRVEVVYRVHMGDLIAFSERRMMDADEDGVISDAEKAVYLDRATDALMSGFALEMDGRSLQLLPMARSDSLGERRTGPMPFEMRFEFRSEALNLNGHDHELSFVDRNYADDPVDPEMALRSGPGVQILDASVLWDSERYPFDPWAGQQERRTLKALFRSGSGGVAFAAQTEPTSDVETGTGIKDRLKDILQRPDLPIHFVLFAFLIAIFLGAMHAVEPGHGKTIVAAYLIGSRGTVWNAVFLGGIVTITHTFSIIVLGLLTLFASQYVVPQKLFPWLGFISGVFIIVVGIWLLSRHLRGLRGHGHSHGPFGHTHDHGVPQPQDHDHGHDDHDHGDEHDHGHEHDGHDDDAHDHHDHEDEPQEESERSVSWGSLLWLGISGGIVPCPAALVILLTAVALNRILFGLALIISFSFGLAVVLITIGVMMVVARSAITRVTGEGRIVRVLPLISAAVIIVLGFGIAVKSLIDGGILVFNL